MTRPFAPTLRPPWIVAACAFAGAAAAWIVTSAAATSLLRAGFGDAVAVRTEGATPRLAYCAWIAITHALAAALHRRFAKPTSSLVAWTFVGATILPGAFLALLFLVIAGAQALRPSLLIEPTLFGLAAAILSAPIVAALDLADREPVPARALATLAAGLLVPWTFGGDRVFALALAVALTLSALALALAAAASRGDVPRVRMTRAGSASYRGVAPILLAADDVTRPGVSRVAVVAALVAAGGVLQIAALARAVARGAL